MAGPWLEIFRTGLLKIKSVELRGLLQGWWGPGQSLKPRNYPLIHPKYTIKDQKGSIKEPWGVLVWGFNNALPDGLRVYVGFRVQGFRV